MSRIELPAKLIEIDPDKKYALILPDEIAKADIDSVSKKLKEIGLSKNIIIIHHSKDLFIQEA